MQRPHHVAHGVWHHQTHEADGANHADDGGRHECGECKQHHPRSAHVDAQCRRSLIAERKGIQHAGIRQTAQQAKGDDHGKQDEFRPAHTTETAQQPEHHVTRLLRIGRGGDDVGGDGIEELRSRHTGQNGTVRPGAHGIGEQRHEKERCKGAGKGAHRQAHHAHANTQDDDQHRTGGGTGGNAQHVRFGQRVAQQCLHHRARQRQAGPTKRGGQGATEAIVPDDGFVDAADVVTAPAQPIGNGVPGGGQRNGQITDAHTHPYHQRDDDQGGQQQGQPQRECAHHGQRPCAFSCMLMTKCPCIWSR